MTFCEGGIKIRRASTCGGRRSNSKQRICAEYARLLKQALASAPPEDAQQLMLLATVTSIALQLGQRTAPLRPATIIENSRTPKLIVDALTR
jgi:hypothetical protein